MPFIKLLQNFWILRQPNMVIRKKKKKKEIEMVFNREEKTCKCVTVILNFESIVLYAGINRVPMTLTNLRRNKLCKNASAGCWNTVSFEIVSDSTLRQTNILIQSSFFFLLSNGSFVRNNFCALPLWRPRSIASVRIDDEVVYRKIMLKKNLHFYRCQLLSFFSRQKKQFSKIINDKLINYQRNNKISNICFLNNCFTMSCNQNVIQFLRLIFSIKLKFNLQIIRAKLELQETFFLIQNGNLLRDMNKNENINIETRLEWLWKYFYNFSLFLFSLTKK